MELDRNQLAGNAFNLVGDNGGEDSTVDVSIKKIYS